MIEIKPNDRRNILNNHKNYDESTLSYWYRNIINRLTYLKPLIDEMDAKGVELKEVSKELAQEVFEITELKKLLETYKV